MPTPRTLSDLLTEDQQQALADLLTPLLTIDYAAEISRLLKPANLKLLCDALQAMRNKHSHGVIEIVVRDGYDAGVNDTWKRN